MGWLTTIGKIGAILGLTYRAIIWLYNLIKSR